MFVLTYIPIPISLDSDGNALNNNQSALASAEDRVKKLEAVYTTLITGIIIDYDLYYNPIQGINYGDQNAVKQALESAKDTVNQLIAGGQSGTEDSVDLTARLDEVSRRLPIAQQRINDLNALQNALNTGTQLKDANGKPTYISGVDNTNINSVRKELERATQYQNELTSMQNFWQTIVDSRMQANKLGDINMDGTVNNGDVLTLQNALTGNLQLNDIQQEAANINGDEQINNEDLQLLSNAVNPRKIFHSYAASQAQNSSGGTGSTGSTGNAGSTGSTDYNVTPTPPIWEFYTGDASGLQNFDDFKMDTDITTQKTISEGRIHSLEGTLETLRNGGGTAREIMTVDHDLAQERLHLGMLNGLGSTDT